MLASKIPAEIWALVFDSYSDDWWREEKQAGSRLSRVCKSAVEPALERLYTFVTLDAASKSCQHPNLDDFVHSLPPDRVGFVRCLVIDNVRSASWPICAQLITAAFSLTDLTIIAKDLAVHLDDLKGFYAPNVISLALLCKDDISTVSSSFSERKYFPNLQQFGFTSRLLYFNPKGKQTVLPAATITGLETLVTNAQEIHNVMPYARACESLDKLIIQISEAYVSPPSTLTNLPSLPIRQLFISSGYTMATVNLSSVVPTPVLTRVHKNLEMIYSVIRSSIRLRSLHLHRVAVSPGLGMILAKTVRNLTLDECLIATTTIRELVGIKGLKKLGVFRPFVSWQNDLEYVARVRAAAHIPSSRRANDVLESVVTELLQHAASKRVELTLAEPNLFNPPPTWFLN